MLNSPIEETTHTIPMPKCNDYYVVACDKIKKVVRTKVIMTYITIKEEAALDKRENISIIRGDKTFDIDIKNIYCYGKIDFRQNSNDMNQMDTFDFLNYLVGSGLHVVSDYDYRNHCCHSPYTFPRWTETFRPSVITQFAHGCLGKPKLIVLFKIAI